MTEDPFRTSTLEAVRAAKKKGPLSHLILVTLGEKGCYYLAMCGDGTVPLLTINSVDTIGAGDAFMGAFISGLLDPGKRPTELLRGELVKILRVANASGALTTTKLGGIPALPTREKVLAFLNHS